MEAPLPPHPPKKFKEFPPEVDQKELNRDLEVVFNAPPMMTKVKVFKDFVLQPKKRKITIRKLVQTGVDAGLQGVVIGGAIGGILAYFFSPSQIAKGIEKGAALGGIVGVACGVGTEILHVVTSEAFVIWKNKAEAEAVYPIFEKYLKENIPAEFLCPYTTGLIKVPFKVHKEGHKTDHVFEREDVLKHLARHNGFIDCPRCTLKITEADLVYDDTYHRRVLQLLKPILLQETKNSVVVAGAQAFARHAQESARNVMQATVEPLLDQLICCSNSAEKDEILETIKKKLKETAHQHRLI